MIWFIIISLLVIGLALLIAEVIFIPGTTIVGILGVIFSIAGVLMSYDHFGSSVGFYVLLGTLIATAVALFFSFRSGAWTRFSLKSSIRGKVNEGITGELKPGDEGIALSALRPSGKAEFKDRIVEVRTDGRYAEAQSKVRIVQIDSNQILVELIN
jgi:membrane-bound ClpP family serine protease